MVRYVRPDRIRIHPDDEKQTQYMRHAKSPKPKNSIAIDDQEADLFTNCQNHDRHAVELSWQGKNQPPGESDQQIDEYCDVHDAQEEWHHVQASLPGTE